MTGSNQQQIGGATPGEPFGPYEVYERLGVGGMATVHRAVERGIEGFERVVALKRLLPHLAEDADFVRSFVREAKLASQLQHINICQLYELGRVGAVYFISMEYIEGRDVRQLLRQARRTAGPPPIDVTVSILAELCDALDYAHHCTDDAGEPLGLVHRDVSPSNLLLASSGHVKIIDFGIAKATSQKLRTQTGRVKGKLAYMSPEAIRGARLDARSDIFSVGVIAHELLTATPLFASKNDYETLTRIQQNEVSPPSAKNPKVPADLDEIVLTALAKNPDDRFSSAGEFRDALDELRMRHQLNATNRAVRAWVSDAFAGGVADPGSRARRASEPSPMGRPSSSASPVGVSPALEHEESASLEAPASVRGSVQKNEGGDAARASSAAGEFGEERRDGSPEGVADEADSGGAAAPESPDAPADREDDVVDLAWGDDNGVPVILDEVPDVSHKSPLPPTSAEEMPAASGNPDRAAVASGGEAGLEHEADLDEDGPTVIALSRSGGANVVEGDEGAGGPQDEGDDIDTPNIWPDGTNPPDSAEGFVDAPGLADEGEAPEPSDGEAGPVATRARTARRRRSPTSIGMTIVSRDRDIKRRAVIGGAVAVAAVAAGALLLALGDSGSSSPGGPPGSDEGTAQAAAPGDEVGGGEDAKVTFSIEPAGAEIRIDDEPIEAGELPHAVELAPGTYRLEIGKPGYESWVETIDVGPNESHVIHKVLDRGGSDQAVVKVRSTPSGLRVKVDGESLDERTPVRIEVEPGTRAVEVLRGGDVWSEEFDAAADTVYAFHAVLSERATRPDRPASSQSPRRTARSTSSSRSSRETGSEAGELADRDAAFSEEAAPAAPASRPALEVESSRSELSPLPFEVGAPPEKGREAGSRQPVQVSGSDVEMISGQAPSLPRRARSSQSQATVKLCIDDRGLVSDVEVLTRVGVDVERALRQGLMRWRFRPHVEGGQRVPACFRQTFRLR